MKKFLALIIVLGLPLVAIPAGAAKGLSNLSCTDIRSQAEIRAKGWKWTNDRIEEAGFKKRVDPRILEAAKINKKSLTQWATIYQAFCKP